MDLPVFFFIDNDFLDDPNVRDVKDVVLSYTFFAARRNKKTGQMEPDTDLENVSDEEEDLRRQQSADSPPYSHR